MTKPIERVTIRTVDGRSAKVDALIDSGSFHTIVRESALPPGAPVLAYATPVEWTTASEGGKLRIVGDTALEVELCGKWIKVLASVSPTLAKPLVIGAGTMQMWDIAIRNTNGKTEVHVGIDMHDPDVTMVL